MGSSFTRPLIILLYVLGGVSVVLAQRSVVFHPSSYPEGKANRPKPRIWPLEKKFVQIPQTVGTNRSNFPNINISAALFADQNETSVAVNPTDGKNIIVGANDYRTLNTLWYFTSTDAGFTWKSAELPSDNALYYATDPSVVFGPDGIAYYGNGRIASGGDPYPINDVISYKSMTKGDTWNSPVRVVFDSSTPSGAVKLADKYYLAVAPTAPGPLAPRVYMAWTEYENGKSRIVASRSVDAGTTWSAPVAVSTPGQFQAPVPAVAVGGEVYIVFIDLDTAKREILFSRSNDGGVTFGAPKKIANYQNLGPLYPPGSPNPHPIIKGHLRVNSFPSIAIDHSFRHFNRIYVTWAGMGSDGRHHIYLSKSDDFGDTWSEALPIESDKSAINTDKFFPWVAVDPTSGIVGVCFYDSRLDAPANQMTDLFLGLSEDGGDSFTVRRISDVSFNPSVTSSTDSLLTNGDTLAFFGDYNGLVAFNTFWYPVWTDSRVGYDQDVYIGIVNPLLPEAVRNLEVREEMQSHTPILTWEHSGLTTFGKPLVSYTYFIRRSDGKGIMLPSSQQSFRDSSVLKGMSYIYEVRVVATDLFSIYQQVRYMPLAVRKPAPPLVITSRAEAEGFFVRFRVPDTNLVGDLVSDLHYLYYIIDDVVVDSFALNDGLRGKLLERSFAASPGYHSFRLAATTVTEGETTSSDTSSSLWLYAGSPRDSYSESFEGTWDYFTISAWDTTSFGLPSIFINDSLPNVSYRQGSESWFMLPSVKLSPAIHTLEFDHIALVAAGDSAIVEVSLDNGVNYFVTRRYDRLSEPLKWQNTLATSTVASDSIPLKWNIGQDAIIRFRLKGENATSEDGWFIDNIRFTDKLSVINSFTASKHSLSMSSSVVHQGSDALAELSLVEGGHVTVHVTDVLGRNSETVFERKYIPAGRYVIDLRVPESGEYFVTATISVPGMPASIVRSRFIAIR